MQAILITAYKNFQHLEDIIDFFESDDFSIYIHIDKKSVLAEKERIRLVEKKNVRLISSAYSINWGGLNHLKAILLLADEALKDKRNTYFHLITGHDYPIKPISEFQRYFEDNSNDYMEFHTLPYPAWKRESGGLDRLSRYNFYDIVDGRVGFGKFITNTLLSIQKIIGFKRQFYKNFPSLYGGSTYWSLRRESVNYVFEYMAEHPNFLQRFKYSFCSEEIFFQTILLNSPLKENIINHNMRFIVWEERNGNFPANLDESDYRNITLTESFFARKFEFPISQKLLKKIKTDINK